MQLVGEDLDGDGVGVRGAVGRGTGLGPGLQTFSLSAIWPRLAGKFLLTRFCQNNLLGAGGGTSRARKEPSGSRAGSSGWRPCAIPKGVLRP